MNRIFEWLMEKLVSNVMGAKAEEYQEGLTIEQRLSNSTKSEEPENQVIF